VSSLLTTITAVAAVIVVIVVGRGEILEGGVSVNV
jgi:hypothetical protein